jgi:hypothetical protein
MKDSFLANGPYDMVLINDIAHIFGNKSNSIYESDLVQLRDRTKLLVGCSAESIYGYRDLTGAFPEFAKNRLRYIENYDVFFDRYWLIDEDDRSTGVFSLKNTERLNVFLSYDIFEFVSEVLKRSEQFIFLGSINEHRQKFLRELKSEELTLLRLDNEEEMYWLPYCKMLLSSTQGFGIDNYNDFYVRLKRKRILGYVNYLKSISYFKGLVHLPTFLRVLHPRFVEIGVFGGIPVMPFSESFLLQNLEPNVHYLAYDQNNPTTLSDAIRAVMRNHSLAELISYRARNLIHQNLNETVQVGNFLREMLN